MSCSKNVLNSVNTTAHTVCPPGHLSQSPTWRNVGRRSSPGVIPSRRLIASQSRLIPCRMLCGEENRRMNWRRLWRHLPETLGIEKIWFTPYLLGPLSLFSSYYMQMWQTFLWSERGYSNRLWPPWLHYDRSSWARNLRQQKQRQRGDKAWLGEPGPMHQVVIQPRCRQWEVWPVLSANSHCVRLWASLAWIMIGKQVRVSWDSLQGGQQKITATLSLFLSQYPFLTLTYILSTKPVSVKVSPLLHFNNHSNAVPGYHCTKYKRYKSTKHKPYKDTHFGVAFMTTACCR